MSYSSCLFNATVVLVQFGRVLDMNGTFKKKNLKVNYGIKNMSKLVRLRIGS